MLPKPSFLNLKDEPRQQINYIISYLTRLVRELDKYIDTKPKSNKETQTVKDITKVDGQLIILFTNGDVKTITIGD